MGWKVWLGVGLLLSTVVMTVVALVTGLGESLQYITFISHLALILTAIDIISTSLANKKIEENNDQEDH